MPKKEVVHNVKIAIVIDGTDRNFEIKGLSEKAVAPVQKFWNVDRAEYGKKLYTGFLEVGAVLLKIREGMKGASTKSIGEAYGVVFPNIDTSDANLRSKCIKLAELANNPRLGFSAWKEKTCPALNAPSAVLDRWAKKDDKAPDKAPDKGADKGAVSAPDKGADKSADRDTELSDRDTPIETLPTDVKIGTTLKYVNALYSDMVSGRFSFEELENIRPIEKMIIKIVINLEAEGKSALEARKAARKAA